MQQMVPLQSINISSLCRSNYFVNVLLGLSNFFLTSQNRIRLSKMIHLAQDVQKKSPKTNTKSSHKCLKSDHLNINEITRRLQHNTNTRQRVQPPVVMVAENKRVQIGL